LDAKEAFTKVHPDWAESPNIYKSWADYMKSIVNSEAEEDDEGPTLKKNMATGKIVVEIEKDENGAPILPDFNPDMRFIELSTILRSFMTEHYKIETGSKSVPWKKLQDSSEVGNYIDPEYLPEDAKLGDPSHIGKTEILEILNFWKDRIDTGEVIIFRFKSSLGKRKARSGSSTRPKSKQKATSDSDLHRSSPGTSRHVDNDETGHQLLKQVKNRPRSRSDEHFDSDTDAPDPLPTTSKCKDIPENVPKNVPRNGKSDKRAVGKGKQKVKAQSPEKSDSDASTSNQVKKQSDKHPEAPKQRPKPIPTPKTVTFMDTDGANEESNELEAPMHVKSSMVSKHVLRNSAPDKYKTTPIHRWMYIKALADDYTFSKVISSIEELPNVSERNYEPFGLPPFATWTSTDNHLPEAFHTSTKLFRLFRNWVKNDCHWPKVNGNKVPLIKEDSINIAFVIGLVLRDLERIKFTHPDEINEGPCPEFVYNSCINEEDLFNTIDPFCHDFLKAVQLSVVEHRKADRNQRDKEDKLAKINQLRTGADSSDPDRKLRKLANTTRKRSEPSHASSSKVPQDHNIESNPMPPMVFESASDVDLPKPKRRRIKPDNPDPQLTPGRTRSITQHVKELGTRNTRSKKKI
jgi:hypothetical protein